MSIESYWKIIENGGFSLEKLCNFAEMKENIKKYEKKNGNKKVTKTRNKRKNSEKKSMYPRFCHN